MKKNKILVPALAILALGTAASVTGTVAWFSANGNVTVSGMAVHTSVSSNMLISATYQEEDFGVALVQGREAFLKPTSTINGVDFFYTSTSNVDAAGAPKRLDYIAYNEATGTALANSDAGKTKYDAGFQTANGITGSITESNVAYGYVDYSFYLKVTNAESSAQDIVMTKCNLLYDGAATTVKAWRVALFAKNLGDTALASATNDEVAEANLVTIMGLSASASGDYFVSGKAAATAYTPDNPGTTETNEYAAGTRDDVSNLSEEAISSVAANSGNGIASGATLYQKLTVRLWLEGEDKDCNNDTFALLTEDWTLDLEFGLAAHASASDSSVNNIGSVAPSI